MPAIQVVPKDSRFIQAVAVQFDDQSIWNPNAPQEDIEQQRGILLSLLAELMQVFTFQLAGVIETPLSIMFLDQMRRNLIELSNYQITVMQKLLAGDDPHLIIAQYAREVGGTTNEPDPTPEADLAAWEAAFDDSQLDQPIDETLDDDLA